MPTTADLGKRPAFDIKKRLPILFSLNKLKLPNTRQGIKKKLFQA